MSAGADDYLIKPVDSFAVQTRLVAAERVTGAASQARRPRTELERANLELLEQSLTDELTGLGNRRRMEEDLARTHARAMRVGRTYGVALFDIDHFKLYNDHYGHLGGDETLRRVASSIDMVVAGGRVRLPLRRRGVPPPHARLPADRLDLHHRRADPPGGLRSRHPPRGPAV